jgi:hypothetical protein
MHLSRLAASITLLLLYRSSAFRTHGNVNGNQFVRVERHEPRPVAPNLFQSYRKSLPSPMLVNRSVAIGGLAKYRDMWQTRDRMNCGSDPTTSVWPNWNSSKWPSSARLAENSGSLPWTAWHDSRTCTSSAYCHSGAARLARRVLNHSVMLKSRSLVAAFFSIAAISTNTASAAEPSPKPQSTWPYSVPKPSPRDQNRVYAWQVVLPTVAFDVLSVVGMINNTRGYGARTYGPPLIAVGWIGRTISGPIVHFSHRRIGAGFASLALEGFTPVIGAAAAFFGTWATCDLEPEDYCALSAGRRMPIGAAIAAVAGTVVDAAVLANEPASDTLEKETVSFAPFVMPRVFPGPRKGELSSEWTFGLAGRF